MSKESPEKVGYISHIIIDCSDIRQVSHFWSEVLGQELAAPTPPYQDLVPRDGDAIVSFQQVEDLKDPSVKNRVHVDVKVDSLGQAEDKIRKLGGSVLRHMKEGSFEWSVVADPEGNEFCLITSIE